MKKIGMLKIAASSLILGTAITPVSASNYGHETSGPQKAAAQAAQQATKLLAKRKFADAVEKAEVAVAAMPNVAEYRALLGQAYLSSGRFQSAETTLGDAVSLDPANARAGLNLALAQIANARSDRALATLDVYRDRLSPTDFGLALALAGDLAGATSVLEGAVRAPEADARTRQNLALAYALSNRWREARIMAAQDLSGDALYGRMTEWAALAMPSSASQQVAGLLKVTPSADPGQPEQLALARGSDTQVALAAPAPVKAEVPVAATSDEPAPVFEVAEVPAPAVAVAESTPAPASIPTAAPAASETVVAKPAPLIRAASNPIKQVVVPASNSAPARPAQAFHPAQSGNYVVQLGAFSSASRSEVAWRGAVGRYHDLNSYTAATARVQVNNATLYRLSVSGFTSRAVAGQVCARIKAAGGDCFVRAAAGDTPLQWASNGGGMRIASRR
ncbi:SPOR domain-containing protein [Aquisediminimonas profunda]|uniref:SPOR domain-containing protein n=1 Tax=Aquisediminimonas profunda TaxID=1550733 RepID=UPI001C6299FA|nr:SPOR domain-containing protein [Aquisediminimonas profunda]